MRGVESEGVLQLTLIATEHSEGLALKSSTSSEKEARNGQVKLCDGRLLNNKIKLLDIVVLNLSHCDLRSVPEEFGAFENLRVLNLSRNKLSVAPECLEKKLRFIEHLDLSCNSLSEFETEPACHKRLKVLLLNDNNLLNIPEWILYVRCFNLEELDYSFNEVNRWYASQFNVSSNYKLKKLGLKSCFIFERDFKYINGIKTLVHLDVSNDPSKTRAGTNNTIRGEKIFQQPNFSNTLQVLKLNYLTLSILSENIVCLMNLKELYLVCNNLSWLPDELISLRNLEILDVSENVICYFPQNMNKMSSLKKIVAHTNSMSQFFDVSAMSQLRYLDLYKNRLSEFPFDVSSVTHLDLEQNCLKTSEALERYSDYVEKRQKLRSTAEFLERSNCAILATETESEESDSSLIFSDDQNEELQQVFEECDEESWDAPYVSDYVRVCTASDDEWLGSEPPLVAWRKRLSKDMHLPRVTPVFLDAEE